MFVCARRAGSDKAAADAAAALADKDAALAAALKAAEDSKVRGQARCCMHVDKRQGHAHRHRHATTSKACMVLQRMLAWGSRGCLHSSVGRETMEAGQTGGACTERLPVSLFHAGQPRS